MCTYQLSSKGSVGIYVGSEIATEETLCSKCNWAVLRKRN